MGRALHVVVAAEDVGAAAAMPHVAGCEQQDAARADIGRPERILSLAHGPDQRRRPLLGEDLCNALDENSAKSTAFALLAESLQFELVSGKSDEGDPWCSGVGNVCLCS